MHTTITTRKVSKSGIFSSPYFPAFGANTEIYGLKYGQRKRMFLSHILLFGSSNLNRKFFRRGHGFSTNLKTSFMSSVNCPILISQSQVLADFNILQIFILKQYF